MLYLSSLQKKVEVLSNLRYNGAIECCRENRISDAINLLNEALKLNKKNISARNLLGLCFYQIGRVAEALINWVISYKYKITDNIAIDYIAELESDRKSKDLYQAIGKYNEALDFAKKGNTDMAILNLKKAIDLNKNFIDAMNLLSLCYAEKGREVEAFKMAEKVLKIDTTNSIAIKYYNLFKPEKKLFFKPKIKDSKTKGRRNNTVSYFVSGFVISSVLIGCMGLPTVIKTFKRDYTKLENEYNILKSSMESEIGKKDETIGRLSEENENLRSRLYTVDSQELQQRIRLLTDIQNYYNEGSIDEAAEKLISLSTAGFNQDVLNKYSQLCKNVLPAAASEYFSLGTKASKNGNYESAKNYFNKAIKCTNEGDEVRYSSMYQLGKIADEQGDKASALNYFKTVAQKHPVESIKKEAQEYVDNAS